MAYFIYNFFGNTILKEYLFIGMQSNMASVYAS